MSKLPTKPGTYYWREKDADEWVAVHVVEDCSIIGHEFGVLFPETQALVDLVDLHGQWLLIPTAQEVMELLRLVDEVLSWGESIVDTSNFPEDGFIAHDFIKLQAYANKLRKGIRE